MSDYARARRGTLAVAVLFAASMLAPVRSSAQFHAGGHVGYASDDVNFGVGARGVYSIADRVDNLAIEAEFTLFFPDDSGNIDVDYWDFGLNAIYSIQIPESPDFTPYAIGGLGIGKFSVKTEGLVGNAGVSDNTEAGLNIGAGVRTTLDKLTPFVELRANVGSSRPDVVALVGLTVPVGQRD